jgi:hypothetical protein
MECNNLLNCSFVEACDFERAADLRIRPDEFPAHFKDLSTHWKGILSNSFEN